MAIEAKETEDSMRGGFVVNEGDQAWDDGRGKDGTIPSTIL